MALFPKISITKHLRVNISELLANGEYYIDEAAVQHPLWMQPIIISSSSLLFLFLLFGYSKSLKVQARVPWTSPPNM